MFDIVKVSDYNFTIICRHRSLLQTNQVKLFIYTHTYTHIHIYTMTFSSVHDSYKLTKSTYRAVYRLTDIMTGRVPSQTPPCTLSDFLERDLKTPD